MTGWAERGHGGRALDSIVGGSAAMEELKREVADVAPTSSTVLLTGETGTGKGLVARSLHRLSRRADHPFVHVDCAALSAGVIESELFGHERGAFTSADSRRTGRFELAGKGTIFLDEIGDLEPRLQSKLLRVLDDRCYERIGGTQTLFMAARVAAATSRDLRRAVREGSFRSDLYYRLNVFQLRLPPLRARIDDLPALVENGLARLARQLAVERPSVGRDFLCRLEAHPWPGNVRELFNVLERLLVRQRGSRLAARHLDGILEEEAPRPTRGMDGTVPAPGGGCRARQTLRDIQTEHAETERDDILAALRATGGNVNRAAERMNLARGTLRYRMRKYGVHGAELAIDPRRPAATGSNLGESPKHP